MTSQVFSDQDRIRCLQALRMVVGSGEALSTRIHEQLLADCFMDDMSDPNPLDPAVHGLLSIVQLEDIYGEILNVGWIKDRMESYFRSLEESVEYIFHPGVEQILEVSSVKNGLYHLNQLFKYLNKNSFESCCAQLNDLDIDAPAMGTESELAYLLGIIISDIHFKVQGEFEPDETIEDLMTTNSLSELMTQANSLVDAKLAEYVKVNEEADETIFTLESMHVLMNGLKAIEIPLNVNIHEEGFKWTDYIESLQVLNENKAFLTELKKASESGSFRHLLKGRLLEQELGL